MSTPAVFGIYGHSDAGKTTLVTRLVSQLTDEGYRVATVKRTNKHITMDTNNKDTWRHHDAGASLVVFSSRSETDVLFHAPMSIPEIIRMITLFGSYDIIIVEGADEPTLPKIQVGAGKKRSNTIASYTGDVQQIIRLLHSEVKKRSSVSRLRITVNGTDVLLTEFPEHIIENTIRGMLQSLKGVATIHDFTIELKQ